MEKSKSNDSSKVDGGKSALDMETMLSWKGQGLLSNNDHLIEKTKCAFKFANTIMNDLDD